METNDAEQTENTLKAEGDSVQRIVSSVLSKRRYTSAEEMAADFWKNHYAKENTHTRPNERLWQRMNKDGVESLARKLWHNQWRMLNGGGCWIPSHGPTNRKLFS